MQTRGSHPDYSRTCTSPSPKSKSQAPGSLSLIPHAQMLWNWHTVDACFLASTWRITSAGMFAGSCIGVVALVVFLEFLRRVSREYDRRVFEESRSLLNIAGTVSSSVSSREDGLITAMSDEKGGDKQQVAALHLTETSKGPVNGKFVRPSLVQQSVRALLYTAQLSLAYILMLLAMSFNGYILVCIFVGGFLGFLVFNWEVRTM